VPAIHLLISVLYICVRVAYSYYLSLRNFPICFFPSSFFRLTFSSISSSISYLPSNLRWVDLYWDNARMRMYGHDVQSINELFIAERNTN